MRLGCGYLLTLRCLLYFLALANVQKSAYLLIEYITGSPKSWQEWRINKRHCVKSFWTEPSAFESTFFKNSRVVSSSNVPDIKYTCLLSKHTKREQNEMRDVHELFCNKQPRIGFVYVLKYGKANMKFITVQNALWESWRKRRCWGGHLWDLDVSFFPGCGQREDCIVFRARPVHSPTQTALGTCGVPRGACANSRLQRNFLGGR